MILEVLILKEVSKKADNYYEKSNEFGKNAAFIFGDKKKSQIRNLENIAYSSSMISHIYDYIKTQTGKSGFDKEWRHNEFGKELLNSIKKLKDDAKEIVNNLVAYSKNNDPDLLENLEKKSLENIISLSAKMAEKSNSLEKYIDELQINKDKDKDNVFDKEFYETISLFRQLVVDISVNLQTITKEQIEELTRQIHLKLIREFIKQLGVHYNFSLVSKQEGW